MSARVLVVENEFMIGLDVSQHLASAGFEVVGLATSVPKAGKPFVVLTGYSSDNLASSFNDPTTILTKPPSMNTS